MPIPARLPTFRSISFEEYLPVPAPRVQLKSVTFEEYKENTVEDFTNWF